MASTPRKRRLLELVTQLARNEIDPDAEGIDWILQQVADGRTFTEIGAELGVRFGANWNGPDSGRWTPSRALVSTTYNNIAPDAKHRILEARREGASALAEQALAIVDNASTATTAAVQKARLQSETRLALAASFDRETFGTRPVEVRVDLGDLHIAALQTTRFVGQPRPQQLEPLDAEILPGSSDDDTNTAPLALAAGISEE